jgi:hypothetical protein
MINTQQSRIQYLKNQQQMWKERIDGVLKNMNFTSEVVQLQNLTRESTFYFEELTKVENELKLLENQSDSSVSSNQENTIIKNLSKLNFSQAKETVSYILEKYLGKKGGLALFLLQNTALMRGDLCVAEIQYCLSSNSYGRFKYCPIDPLLRPDISDERSLLNAIADYFKPIEPELNEQQYAQKIIEKIVDTVQGNSIVFFDFTNWDSLPENDSQLLSWFVKNFWQPLKEKHKDICKSYSLVKFILFISTSSTISETYNELCWSCDSIDNFCHNINEFESLKIPELPLSNWQESDIDDWLQEVYGLSKLKSQGIAQTIYRLSNRGIPVTVCSKLEQSLAQLLKE